MSYIKLYEALYNTNSRRRLWSRRSPPSIEHPDATSLKIAFAIVLVLSYEKRPPIECMPPMATLVLRS